MGTDSTLETGTKSFVNSTASTIGKGMEILKCRTSSRTASTSEPTFGYYRFVLGTRLLPDTRGFQAS